MKSNCDCQAFIDHPKTFGAGKLQITLWIGIANSPANTTPHDCPIVVRPNPKHLYCIGNSFDIRLNVLT